MDIKNKTKECIAKDVVEYGKKFEKNWEKKDMINKVTFGGQNKNE